MRSKPNFMKDIKETEHDFQSGESLQWGALGLPWESAQTPFVCTKCGQSFVHFYHITPNIFEAMKQVGIDPDNL